MNALSQESHALCCLIKIAPADGDLSAQARQRARNACACALRTWRAQGDRKRAIWLRNHISWVGYPLSEQQLLGSANRHKAWWSRYQRKEHHEH